MQTINPIIKRILLFKTAISPSLFGLIKQSDKKNPKINPPKCPKILISVLSIERTNKLIKIIKIGKNTIKHLLLIPNIFPSPFQLIKKKPNIAPMIPKNQTKF